MLSIHTDPIFAVINQHKQTQTRLPEACRLADAVLAKQEGREVTCKETAALMAADDAEEAATDARLSTPPGSVAGVRAAIGHFLEVGEHLGRDWNVAVPCDTAEITGSARVRPSSVQRFQTSNARPSVLGDETRRSDLPSR